MPRGKDFSLCNKEKDIDQRKYANSQACESCPCKDKCTTSKNGRVITRKTDEDIVDIVTKRTKGNKAKYSQRQEIIEHVFGTLKRGMNFDYLLLRGFEKVKCEVSIAFFSYNLKRTINILGVEKFLGYLVTTKKQQKS